ncbi:hypothetical protein [Streptomyces puniciscabiei]|uniref:hypothetical protein n=1 Tax=Streptomyces puniciscabiei TaxID=164348 RepID=UPI00332EF40D
MTAHRPSQGSAAATAVIVPLLPHTGPGRDATGTGADSFITELTTAIGHLEKALKLGQTPARLLLPNGATVTAAQLSLWVTQHSARAQILLDHIKAPHTGPQT